MAAPSKGGVVFEERDNYVKIYNMSNFESMLFSDSLKMKMINLAMSKTFNKFDAEDLVQQTYLKAIERQDQFKGDEIDPWVITILKNLFTDSTRKGTFKVKETSRDFYHKKIEETRRVKRVKTYGDETPEVSVIDQSDELILERDKEKCLEKLSLNERDIISLKQTDSYDEISKAMDIKVGTVRQIIYRAKDKFMRCMGFFDD